MALKGLVAGAAVFFGVMYVITAIPRLLYPYDLDFIEDGLLMTSWRFATGQPVFLPPNADFVPHVYMPLYSWLGSLLFALTGPGFAPLRWLSFTALLTCTGLIFGAARRESGQSWLGLVCAGLLLGGYRINGFWYELARVDMLFVALTLSGLTLVTYSSDKNLGLMGAGTILALAFLTKQTGLIFGLSALFYLLIAVGPQAWWFGMTFGLLALIPVVGLNWLTAGWFGYYTFHIASVNPIAFERIIHYLGPELLGQMAGLSLMAMTAGVLGYRRVGWRMIIGQPWLIWIGVAALVSGLGRASVGGNLNNLMPVYTLLCLAPALLWRAWSGAGQASNWQAGLISGLVLAQFALGVYNPLRYIPTPEMRQSGDRLIKTIAATEGEVLVLMHPYYTWLAGKTPSAQMAALWHARERGAQPLPQDLVERIKNHYYAVIISDNSLFETEPALQQLLHTYYQPAQTLEPDDAPATLTGMVVWPAVVYVPKM
jgi:4-amino-4-deoxy-L-arabinose transferase-like glycosyltransferase